MEQQGVLVFKIFRAAEWSEACRAGAFAGSPDDKRDGYIHLSCGHQLAATAAKYFRGEHGLVLAAFAARALGPALRWEPARGGELFPHLYGPLDLAALRSTAELPLGPDGVPLVPEDATSC